METLSEATQLVVASIKKYLQYVRRWRHLSKSSHTTSYHPQLITVSLCKSLQRTMRVLHAQVVRMKVVMLERMQEIL
jgi:hypothetical protein